MDKLEEVSQWIETNQEEIITFLQNLVRIPSVNPWFFDYNPYTTENTIQLYLADSLEKIGFDVSIWEVDEAKLAPYAGMPGYYSGRPMKDRPNLCGILKGGGGGKSVLLTGHCDTVMAGKGWTKNPFGAEIIGNDIYGLGTVDMKGGIAAMIMSVKAILACGIHLKGDILVGTTPDEEAGGMGALEFVHHGITADGAIMTEPTNSREIGSLCRGILWGKIVIPARSGHIEMPQKYWREGGAVDGIKLVQLYLAQIDSFNEIWKTKKSYPLLKTPCQLIPARIVAGEYPSAYAGSAEIYFDAQYLPSDLDEKYHGTSVKHEIENFVQSVAETNEWLRENPPHVEWLLDADCAETPINSPFIQTMMRAARKVMENTTLVGVGCHTDMSQFVHMGIPTINFGPGDPMLAHMPDERINIDNLLLCTRMIASMLLEWCEIEN